MNENSLSLGGCVCVAQQLLAIKLGKYIDVPQFILMGVKTMNGRAYFGRSVPSGCCTVPTLLLKLGSRCCCVLTSDLERYTLDWCVGGDSFRIDTSL